MSGNDYVEKCRKKNPKLFNNRDAKILIKVSSLEDQLRAAFDAGAEDGFKRGKQTKSVFDQVFG